MKLVHHEVSVEDLKHALIEYLSQKYGGVYKDLTIKDLNVPPGPLHINVKLPDNGNEKQISD